MSSATPPTAGTGADLLDLLDHLHKTVSLLYAMEIRERDSRAGTLAELEAMMRRIDHLADVARRLP